MRKFFAILAVAAAFTGCKHTDALLPNVSGKAGEVIVVIDKEDWEGALGTCVRELLAADCPYLAQREPLYTLVNVAPGGFSELLKVHRNIVHFSINGQADSTRVVYKRNLWAAPQCIIQVVARSTDEALELVGSEGAKMLSALEQAERDRVIANSKKYEETTLAPQVAKIFGGTATFPMGYKMRKATEDFVWIADDKQYTMQDILIYRYPAIDDEPFSMENIIRHRNEILKDNVPGMLDNSWMTTSEGFPASVEFIKYQGREFAQTRGYWEVENDYMGGPFVSHSFYSPDGFDIIVLDAFVYAPRFDKRQYLRQVESILYSWHWLEQ